MLTINLYQINIDRDSKRVVFESLDRIPTPVNASIYDKVYSGTLANATNLEDLYRIFNIDIPSDCCARSMSVSDVVQVTNNGGEVEPGFYYCDSIGFKPIDFDPNKAYNEKPQHIIRVLRVEPRKKPEVIEIDRDLKSLQNAIGDKPIEAYYPFNDAVCVICDEEGKLNGSLPNRGVCDDETDELLDIVFGTFLVVGCKGENFSSLSDKLLKKYEEYYHYPERFVRINGEIRRLKIFD